MDKDNSQESMISSNSLSFGKNRGEAYYSSNPTFYVGIDCIIFGFNEGEISLLLLKRNFEPAMGEWSLMGGFVQNNESVDDAAKRVLHELTGLENVYMEQVGTFGAIDRDPGERVISVAYYALININEYDRKLVQKHNAYWVNMNELPPLIFDMGRPLGCSNEGHSGGQRLHRHGTPVRTGLQRFRRLDILQCNGWQLLSGARRRCSDTAQLLHEYLMERCAAGRLSVLSR